MKNKTKYVTYLIVVIVLVGVFCVLHVNRNQSHSTANGDIELDDNGKQIIDNEGKTAKMMKLLKGELIHLH